MKKHTDESGFSLLAAILMLVIFGVLTVVMINISAVSHSSSTLSIQALRAYHAARSGLEWGTFLVITHPGGTGACSTYFPTGGPTVFTETLSFGANSEGLNGASVRVSCVEEAHPQEGGAPPTYPVGEFIYRLRATAVFSSNPSGDPNDPDYATRTLEAIVIP